MLLLIAFIAVMLTRQCPKYRLEQDILQLASSQFIILGRPHRELLYRQKDGTGATSYASLAACSSAESAGPKTTPPATSRSVGAGGPVHLANRFALLSDDSVWENTSFSQKLKNVMALGQALWSKDQR
ncbi:hypothetical protein E2C01_095495 [Portunus trituberculatus]|uniref:Uncharacterized protein n=1 Tax=Portunus trituberculatus TaxID=210409 RepID=A0A5B7K0C2_PORTR|nr:hypothetical protein [Portunus trituberculatus]